MNRKYFSQWLIGLSSLTSTILHGYLTWEYFLVKYSLGSDQNRLCQISDKFDCAAVAASPYSSLFDIPISLFGLWTNFLLFIFLLIFIFQKKWFESVSPIIKTGLLLFASSTLLGTLIMGTIAVTIMKTYCTFCIGTYVLSVLTLIGFFIESKKDPSLWKPQIKFDFYHLVLLVSIPLLAWFSYKVLLEQVGGNKLSLVIEESLLEWEANPKQEFNLTSGILLGPPPESSSSQIVEFIDLFCPHCKYASRPLKAFTKTRQDVSLTIKLFPLDGQCNLAVSPHDGGRCQWSYAVTCANDQQKGALAIEWVFKRQNELLKGDFIALSSEMSQSLNLNEEVFKTCLSKEETKTTVMNQAKEGENAKIRGTPSLFYNGKLLPRAQLLPVLEAAARKK